MAKLNSLTYLQVYCRFCFKFFRTEQRTHEECVQHTYRIIIIIIIIVSSSTTANYIRIKPVGYVIRIAASRNIQKNLTRM